MTQRPKGVIAAGTNLLDEHARMAVDPLKHFLRCG
jgi:hypothetical protein